MTQIGTFDLSDLCGCGSDCPECCGTPSPCCPLDNIPLTLFVTITNLGACTGVDGVVLTLTYNAGTDQWEGTTGSHVCGGGDALSAILKCMGTDCTGWFFAIGTGTTCGWTPTQISCNCSPFELVYTGSQGIIGCPCCAVGEMIHMDITG